MTAATFGQVAGRLPAGTGKAGGALLGLLAWELLAQTLAGSFLLAGPVAVAGYIVENTGLLGRALAITLGEATAGFVLGNLAAVALATVAAIVPRLERLIATLALVVFCLPLVATGPILRVLYGPGVGPQITLAALAVYYTTLVPLLVGLRAAPATWFDLVTSYGRGRWAQLVHVRARASLPYLVAGLQIAAPAAFLGAMVGEFTGAERGMGVLAIRAMSALDAEATWALATIAAAVSMAAYAGIGWIGRRLMPDPPPLLLAPPVEAVNRSRWRGITASLGRLLLATALILSLWHLAMVAFDLNNFFAKRPIDVWRFLVAEPQASAHRAELSDALGETLVYVFPGFLAGLATGAVAAMAVALWPPLAALAMPIAVALRSIPIVTTAPLVILLLGRGATGTVTLVAVMIFFPTFVACLHGLGRAPGQVLDVFDSYAAGRWKRLVHAQIPAMLPAFFAAARMSVPAAVLAVTVVEWLATGNGIGSLMALSASLSNYGMLWSTVVVVTALSCAGYAGVAALERWVLSRFAAEQAR